jgi:putative Mg2+ transporter-C (MgtC) family protein
MNFGASEIDFTIKILYCLAAGILIGFEREARGKPAGISTHALVIGGSMMFTILSLLMDPNEPARIAAQIVTGIGFLGAGIILKTEGKRITNLTTAASIWFSAGIGMAIGFDMYWVAGVAILYALVVPRIPRFGGGSA